MENNNKKAIAPSLGNVYTLGIPVKTKKDNIYAIKKPAILNVAYMFTCPKCAHIVRVNLSDAGLQRVTCKNCGIITLVKGIDRSEVARLRKQAEEKNSPKPVEKKTKEPKPAVKSQSEEKPQPKPENEEKKTEEKKPIGSTTPFFPSRQVYNAKICWGGLLNKKVYELRDGENWIGRKDKELPSDISVKDDYMSRQSVCIERKVNQGTYTFKMTVRKASNPVYVNGRQIDVDETIFLNYDDVIKLGETTFTVKKIVK